MTNADPWGEEPEAPVQAPAVQKTAVTREQAPSNEGVTVTLKAGSGFEKPWIVIHAADPASALAQLNDPTLKELADLTAKVGQYFAGKGAQTPAGGSGGQAPSNQSGGDKPPYQQAPGGAKYCAHGEMSFKSGTSKAGKAYSGHFCPERDRDQQCKAIFL